MQTKSKEGVMCCKWARIARGIAVLLVLVVPVLGMAQVSLDPYDVVDKLSENNAKSVGVLSSLYAEVDNEFQALKAQYSHCQSQSGNEQSLCLGKYERDLEAALTMVKERRAEVMRELAQGKKAAISDKDDYFEAPGSTESFVTALVNEDPDDPGMMVAEQVLDAIDLHAYASSFFGEVRSKMNQLRKAHVTKMKIALSDIEVPDVPDPGEAKMRADKSRKKRWAQIMVRISGKNKDTKPGQASGGKGGMTRLPGDSR
jgi:hypothetical protein